MLSLSIVVIGVGVLCPAVVLDGVDAQEIGLGLGIAPDQPDGVASFREAVFPGRFQFAGGTLHREEGDLVQRAVDPDFDFGHVRVVLFGEGDDFAADMLLGHAGRIVGRNAPQAYQVAPDDETVAGEVEGVFPAHPVVFLVPLQREGVDEILLQRQHFGPGDGDGDGIVPDLAAVLRAELQRLGETVGRALGERDIRALEIEVPDFHDGIFPEGRHILEPQHDTKNATHSCRIAIGILTATGRYFQ